MATEPRSREELLAEIEILHRRLEEAEEIQRAIQANEVDAFVVTVPQGDRIFTLQGAEHPYRVLVESMNEGAATLAPDGSMMYSNHRLAELLKIPLQKLIGSMLHSYVAPADALSFAALLEKCEQARCKGEIELITGTGETLPVLLSCGQLDPSESPGWFSVVITDLSEQKRTEAIIMAEKLARSIIDQAGEAIVVCDTNGQIIRTSQQANQLCQECLLLQPFDTVLPLQITGTDRFFSVAAPLHGTVLRDVEVVLEAKTAQPFYLLLNATPLRNAQDEILGCVITLTDITARQQTEVALRQAAIVFESTREGITIADTDTSILRVNRAFCELTGYTEDEVSGQPLRILQSVSHSQAFYTAIWAHLRHAGHWQGEICCQRKNGAVFPALLSISVVKNETGSVTHYVSVLSPTCPRSRTSEAQLDFLTLP
jgi:PAS domain S-box-containing protein